MDEFKDKIDALVNLKYDHLEDIIVATKKHRDELVLQLEQRKSTSQSEKGNLYLEGIIDGVSGVIQALERYVNDGK